MTAVIGTHATWRSSKLSRSQRILHRCFEIDKKIEFIIFIFYLHILYLVSYWKASEKKTKINKYRRGDISIFFIYQLAPLAVKVSFLEKKKSKFSPSDKT